MTLLRKLFGPGRHFKLIEHFMMTVILGVTILGGMLWLLSGTGPPLVNEIQTPRNPIEIVLDPPTPDSLAPIPMQGR